MKTLILALAVAAGPAAAGELTDLIMAPGVIAGGLEYDHTRHLAASKSEVPQGVIPPREIDAGQVRLDRVQAEGGPKLALMRVEDGRDMPAAEFSALGPNPVLLMFLENIVRNVAVTTGGSPYYIRNRIRDALAAAPVQGGDRQVILLHPFRDDPNAARLGDFATLAIAITLDPAQPGRLIELKADTGAGAAGYTETLKLTPEE